jgi:hypothetical protein
MNVKQIMRSAIFLFLMSLMTVCAGMKSDKGLVAHYTFDAGEGSQAKDQSGTGNDGTIHGAGFVESPKGHALRFDGVDDFVDGGTDESLRQIELAATVELWVKPEELQGGLANWSTGSGWEDQRFVVAFQTRDGGASLTHAASDGSGQGKRFRQYGLELPLLDSWNHVALTSDGGTITYHLNGRMLRVHSQQFARAVLEGIPLWIGRCAGLGKEYFKGTMDEVRIYNRALSDEEILAHYKEDAAAFGKDTSRFKRPEISIEALPEPGWIAVEVDYGLMRPLPEGSSAEAQIVDAQGTKTFSSELERVQPRTMTLNIVLNVAALQPGDYLIRTGIVGADGSPIGETVQTPVSWPGQSEAFKGVKILNNLVWELLNVQPGRVEGEKSYAFNSPKSRWLHVEATVDSRKDGVRLAVDAGGKTREIIVFEAGEKGAREAMCFLPVGECKLTLQTDGRCRVRSLVARSIPELYYHEFFNGPSPSESYPDPAEFTEKHVIDHVNTFMIAGGVLDDKRPIFQKYLPTHRRWLSGFVLKGMDYFGEAYALSSSQEVYDYLCGLRGYTDPELDGVIGDEFLGGEDPGFKRYTDAIGMIEANPDFKDKLFYAYCTDIYGTEQSRELVKTVIDAGGTLVWERYLKTMSSENAAREHMREHLVLSARKYRDLCPGSIEHMTALIGYYTLPGGHLENSTPSINFKTHLDMQFNIVANDPVFWGAYGLGGYHSSYSNEETIRWMLKLFRHYGIEGNAEPATDEPYILPHIKNPDFIHDTEGWTLDPAGEGSIHRVFERGFGWHQARIGRTEGDTSLVTIRSAKRPNRFSQKIKNLQPGRLYSFYMFSGDHKDMSIKEEHAVRIQFENATLIPEKGYTYVHTNVGGSRAYPPYSEEGSAWLNYYYRVFRANGHSGKLIVSDWASDEEPGGPIGQELMYNFICVQPYFPEP